MSRPSQSGEKSLPLSAILRQDEACLRFEAAWKAGERPHLEDYLRGVPEPERSALLRELLAVELGYRIGRGETPSPDDYRGRFPEDTAVLHSAFGEVQTVAQRPAGQPPTRLAGATPAPGGSASDTPFQGPRQTHAAELPRVAGYEILGVLGRGGMGVVYRALQVKLSRMVALKMVLAGAHAGPETLARFQREAEAVARLPHPHIVQIYEIGEQDGLPYFALEFLEGGSLAQKLAGKPLPAAEAARLLEQLAGAMHAAHQQGIVHRDLKPANILLAADGTPKISDFGLAKRLDAETAATRTGAIMGTPSYMAPEQASGHTRDVGPAADVYALGAILYELLTGRPPFLAATPMETVAQVLSQEVVSPSRLQARLPRDLETICLKCLQKEPVKRYASAAALADDLRRFLDGRPIAARPVGTLERFGRWCRRKPVVAGLLAALCLVVLGALGTVTAFWRQAAAQSQRAETEAANAARQADRATAESERAKKNLSQALKAVDQMLTRIGDERLQHIPQFDEERRRILGDAVKLYQELLDENSTEPRARLEAGRAYGRVGEINGLLGEPQAARKAFEHSVGLLEALNADYPGVAEYQAALAGNCRRLGMYVAAGGRGNVGRGLELVERARSLWQTLSDSDPASLDYIFGLADAHYQLGGLSDWARRPRDAEAHYLQTVALQKRLVESPAATTKQKAIASVYCSMGAFFLRNSAWTKAEEALGNGLHIFENLAPENPTVVKFQQEWAFAATSLGGLALRQSHWRDAEMYFRGALKPLESLARDHPTLPGAAENYCGGRLNLAQALEPQGKSAATLAEYRRAREQAEKIPQLRQRTEDLLRACERRTKLEDQLSAFLRGEAKAADASEYLDLAALCQTRKMLYAAAARFYEQAFQAQPALAADMQRQHRYNAACAAALAGCGQGKDGDTLAESERGRWRRQAFDWLRADLAYWTKQVESGPPQARGLVQQTLRHWQGDSDLAGVRDPAEVAKLPEKEREACRQIWSEVDALLARARGGK